MTTVSWPTTPSSAQSYQRSVAFISSTTGSSFAPHNPLICPCRKIRLNARIHRSQSVYPSASLKPTSPDSVQPSPSIFQTWRSPRWIHLSRQMSSPGTNSDHPNVSPSSPTLRDLPLKLLCAVFVTSFVPALAVTYIRLDSFARELVTTTVSSSLDRPIQIGRITRFNPLTGIRLTNVSLPPTAEYPTAPVLSAKQVDITLSGFLQAISLRTPLSLNVTLNHANMRVSQRVVTGPKGLPISQWDSGFTKLSSTNSPPHVLDDQSESSADQTTMLQSPSSRPFDLARVEKILRFVQPGALSVRNAYVTMQPVDFQDYSHGDEPVNFRNGSVNVTFPKIYVTQPSQYLSTESPQNAIQLSLDGDVIAAVKGTSVEGGTILMTCTAKGDKLLALKPEDPFIHMRVTGQGVRADRVASFLSFPFRADQGRCAADVEMDFLYRSKSQVPIIQGWATLEDVSLRFHPDPKTPEFSDINGTLRFVEKMMYVEDSKGVLGSLPMDVQGNIHLEDGYNLTGYAHPVDVNNILDTFDVEKFVPIQGIVSGEARLSGILEEPMVSATATSVETEKVELIFDRLPLSSATVSFDWDAVGGILKYPKIEADVKGGGVVSGSGSMYFDMTKENEWNIRQEKHSERNPKAKFSEKNTEDDEDPKKILPPLPSDIMEIDDYAPCREYDSMRFIFRANDVNGGDLLKYFGGECGEMARYALGRVNGEAIMAGHVKDANCRVLWKSITPPPDVSLVSDVREEKDEAFTSKRKTELDPAASKDEMKSAKKSEPLPANIEESVSKVKELNETVSVDEGTSNNLTENAENDEEQRDVETNTNVKLGGGDFSGLVYIKFGDPPEARRVKVRTVVDNFDTRRSGWASDELRNGMLQGSPQLVTKMDTFFKGVMFQQPILPPGVKEIPRTPRMKLLGVDGVVAVKGLSLNDLKFNNVMSGSFSFGTTDFAMSLHQVSSKLKTDKDHWELTSHHGFQDFNEATEQTSDTSNAVNGHNFVRVGNDLLDELTLMASAKTGEGRLILKQGSTDVVASLIQQQSTGNEVTQQIGHLKTRNLSIQDIFGSHVMANGTQALTGTIDTDLDFDMTSRIGDGNILFRDASFGCVQLSSVGGDIRWNGDNVILKNAFVKHHNSEYNVNGRYVITPSQRTSSSLSNDFESSLNIGVRGADYKDVSKLLRNGKALVTALSSDQPVRADQNDGKVLQSQVMLPVVDEYAPKWLRNLVQCATVEDEERKLQYGSDRWDIPANLTASQKAEWLMRIAEERKELERVGRLRKNRRHSKKSEKSRRNKQDTSLSVNGNISGQIRLAYNSRGNSPSSSTTGSLPTVSAGIANENGKKPPTSSRSRDQQTNELTLDGILDELSKARFSFELTGNDFIVGDLPLRNVSASGLYEEGVLTVGPMSFEGLEGQEKFDAEAEARITHAGGIDGSVIVRKAPASLVQRYTKAPVTLNGSYSGRLEVEGNISNPRALGRVVWTDASLNGEKVRDARGDLACVNGRCLLNVNGRIGKGAASGKNRSGDSERLETLNWGRNVSNELKDLASRTPNKQVRGAEANKNTNNENKKGSRNNRPTTFPESSNVSKDGLQVQVSAPVRFYLVNYLRKQAENASSASHIWKLTEPVLGTSSAPSDDEWIVANVDIKKYGLILLNSMAPQVGWEGGNSDVNLRVSGTIEKPVVAGKISISDGRLSPVVLDESVTGVRGEIGVERNGVVSLKSLSGRCDGKWMTVNGEMFMTDWHKQRVETELVENEQLLNKLSGGNGDDGQKQKQNINVRRNRKRRRVVTGRINELRNTLQKTEKGVGVDFGDVGVDIQKAVVSKVSGKLSITGVANEPCVGGSLFLSDGVVFLGNVGSVSSTPSASSSTSGRAVSSKPTTRSSEAGSTKADSRVRTGDIEEEVLKQSAESKTALHLEHLGGNVGNNNTISKGVKFNNLKVSLGRNMKMVQSFVLSIQTNGEVTVNGRADDLEVGGMIRLLKGNINLLASRMRLSRAEASYVKLPSKKEWESDYGLTGDPEMVMRLVMEDDNLVVSVGECGTSQWMDHIVVRNKRRGDDSMAMLWDDGEDSVRRRVVCAGTDEFFAMRRQVVLKSLLKIGQVGGRLGKVEWRLFPSIVTDSTSGAPASALTKDDLGAGAKVDVGGMSVSAARSSKGNAEGRLELRLGRWCRLRLGGDRNIISVEMDLFGRLGSRKPK